MRSYRRKNSYDDISRLNALAQDLGGSATGYDVTATFEFNPASQIVTRAQSNNLYDYPITNSNQSYTVNGRNQYTQIAGDGAASLTWDANGNLTCDGATTFGYDTENRLVSASGAKNASLTYDPLGRLYKVTSAGVTTQFVYDGDRLIEVTEAVDQPGEQFHGPHLLVDRGKGQQYFQGLFE